jgi:hypothetical protein
MKSVTVLLMLLVSSHLCYGYGTGDVTVILNGGANVVYGGAFNTLEIWIANDARLNGESSGFEFYWPTQVMIVWNTFYGSSPPVQEHGDAIGAWILGGLNSVDDFSSIGSPDHIMFGGASMPPYGLPPNSSRLCYSLTFVCIAPPGTIVNGFCVEPYFYPPAGSWTFTDDQGGYAPDFCGTPTGSETSPVGLICFDITDPPPMSLAGDLNCDGLVDIDDVVYMVAYIFLGGPPPKDPNNDGVPDC